MIGDRPAATPKAFGRGCGRLLLLLAAIWLSACASLPAITDRIPEPAFAVADETALGQMLAPRVAQHPQTSGFRILDSGQDALVTRLALVESAEKAIDAQYYIWHSDASGRYLARRLLAAADRGVHVRVLLDDVNVGDRDALLVALDSHPEIEVRIYNPSAGRSSSGKAGSFITEFGRMNRRMHNKTFVVDAAAGIVGGRNIGDEYFNLSTEMNFRDRDLLAIGPVVADISANFDAYWNSSWAYPIDTLAAPETARQAEQALSAMRAKLSEPADFAYPVPPPQKGLDAAAQSSADMVWARAELIFDVPAPRMQDHDEVGKVAEVLGALARATQHELLIESAYFVLGSDQQARIAELVQRGVTVRALTNSLAANDVIANHAAYAGQRRAYLRQGGELYEYRPDAAICRQTSGTEMLCGDSPRYGLHAKSAVFDGQTVFVGSFNVNLRSRYLNFETALVVHSPELAEQMARSMGVAMKPDSAWRVSLDERGRLRWSDGENHYSHDPDSSWWNRFKVGLINLLPIEKYL